MDKRSKVQAKKKKGRENKDDDGLNLEEASHHF